VTESVVSVVDAEGRIQMFHLCVYLEKNK